ncbi:nuclear transport factor 2 family protein [Duganella aceris]|uniref:Nuclear transport factor 2 family protein n=1 Tax=Duganella aceris TaxID=2703883 RepID=A0ABX0FJC5_9BURK|nr:nuclear transport factor 2 family protein [Duganella aceris]NGZ84638.1 nuclear transport factor 2 family protein [Duganella aceris]
MIDVRKLLLIMVVAVASAAVQAEESPQQALLQLVQSYSDAQIGFEPQKIDAVVTRDFIEVSPAGEVDPREKVLGFYEPSRKKGDPQRFIASEPVVRVFGNAASVIVNLTGSATVNGEKRSFSFRAGYLAVKEGGQWKLASAQYTGIRPPKNPG